jgi:hypothetical protein
MDINDKTPVLVEWYVHTYIPSKHHVVIVDYGTAKNWAKHYSFIKIQLLDPALRSDMTIIRR